MIQPRILGLLGKLNCCGVRDVWSGGPAIGAHRLRASGFGNSESHFTWWAFDQITYNDVNWDGKSHYIRDPILTCRGLDLSSINLSYLRRDDSETSTPTLFLYKDDPSSLYVLTGMNIKLLEVMVSVDVDKGSVRIVSGRAIIPRRWRPITAKSLHAWEVLWIVSWLILRLVLKLSRGLQQLQVLVMLVPSDDEERKSFCPLG